MKMTNVLGLVMLMCVLFSVGYGQEKKDAVSNAPERGAAKSDAPMSAEEKLIRLVYKKLSIYNVVSKYRDGKPLQEIMGDGNSLRFTLSNFKSGPIDEIRNSVYHTSKTGPTGEIIELTRSTIQQTFEKDKREEQTAYRARWVPGKYARISDRNWTFGDIFKIETAKYYDLTRYTIYDVTVSFEGKSRIYRAVVLYHGDLRDLNLEFWDSVVGMGGNLTQIWEEQRTPFGLHRIGTSYVDRTYNKEEFTDRINNFLAGEEPAGNRIEQGMSCPAGSSDIKQCCIDADLAKFWNAKPCGGWWKEIETYNRTESGKDLERDIQFYNSDYQYHIGGGRHWGRTRFRPECLPEANNRQYCNMQLRDQGYGDTEDDHDDNYYHVGNMADQTRGLSGPRG